MTQVLVRFGVRWVVAGIVLLLAASCGSSNTKSASNAATRTPGSAGASSSPTVSKTLTRVTFQAGFKPQANLPFVAAYVAKDNGYFADEGLDVEIQHSSGQDAHLALLGANRIQFSTTTASAILKQRATTEIPLQAVALFGQRGDTVMAVLTNSGINTPKDFEGRTVGYKSYPSPEYLGLLRAAGVDRGKVKEVAVGFDPRILTERRVDALPVFRSNEPDQIHALGFEVKTFDPADWGVPSLGVVYVVNGDWAAKNDATVTAFLRATMRATAWILDHRDQAIDTVMRYAPGEQREHQRFMLDVEIDAAQNDLTRTNGVGWMEEGQWQRLLEGLLEYKAIDKSTDPKKAFTTRYLAPVYQNGRLVRGP